MGSAIQRPTETLKRFNYPLTLPYNNKAVRLFWFGSNQRTEGGYMHGAQLLVRIYHSTINLIHYIPNVSQMNMRHISLYNRTLFMEIA